MSVYEHSLLAALDQYTSGSRVLTCPSSPGADRSIFPIDYGFNWDVFAGKTTNEAMARQRAFINRDSKGKRYYRYLFDEWRVDQKSQSYSWHSSGARVGVNNSVNLLYDDLSVSAGAGWDRYSWQLEGTLGDPDER